MCLYKILSLFANRDLPPHLCIVGARTSAAADTVNVSLTCAGSQKSPHQISSSFTAKETEVQRTQGSFKITDHVKLR